MYLFINNVDNDIMNIEQTSENIFTYEISN